MQSHSMPLLQLALDYVSLPQAIAMALQVAPYVDIIEIGTPLCKAAGIEAVRAVREVCPDKLILADLKTPDVGGLEAQMAFDAGADMMTVIGGAPMATVESALDVARQRGKEMLMELTGVRDIIARAKEWRAVGVERMVYHRGWDEQAFHREWSDDDRKTVRQLIDMGFKVTVTGGITVDLLPFFQELPVSVIIAGRAIHKAKDPAASAREMRSAIHRLWGSPRAAPSVVEARPVASNMAADLAAKAIRWGISEMGLLLTMDGRNCPGCDAPDRFCRGTITEIQSPGGIPASQLVQVIAQIFGPGGAFGQITEDVFYLDPAQLDRITPERITDLLMATGNALRQLSCPVDVNTGVGAANRILASL
jgi:3-dehydro-L-gulonate-6-phosphate decarboxylase